MKNQNIILAAEEQFAREVILGIIVSRPVSIWKQFIPGMFIIDFLQRTGEIRRFTRYFMFPRKIALTSALTFINGEDKSHLTLIKRPMTL